MLADQGKFGKSAFQVAGQDRLFRCGVLLLVSPKVTFTPVHNGRKQLLRRHKDMNHEASD